MLFDADTKHHVKRARFTELQITHAHSENGIWQIAGRLNIPRQTRVCYTHDIKDAGIIIEYLFSEFLIFS